MVDVIDEVGGAPEHPAPEHEWVVVNGIDGETGEYLVPPLDLEAVAAIAEERPIPGGVLAELRAMYEAETKRFLDVRYGVDRGKLDEAGWGVIFGPGVGEDIRQALRPLLDLRAAQAGAHYRELFGADGYRSGEDKLDFLTRLGAAPGPVEPERLPYYLLLVGGPESIPFHFQYQLDVQYAVGRVSFESTSEYRAYARGVVAAERGEAVRPRRAAFFAPANAGDRATHLSATELVTPLAASIAAAHPGWDVRDVAVGGLAGKAWLTNLLTGESAPALLFTASHGAGFQQGHPLQRRHQGALVCQEWPGPRTPVTPAHYLSVDDVGPGARVAGMIAFQFACFGAGTPRLDDFGAVAGAAPELAPEAFVAALPQCLLAHASGAALAVVGHVDRAWSYSFAWPGVGRNLATFESVLRALLDGQRLGAAMEPFHQRYAEIATDLATLVRQRQNGKVVDERRLVGLWMACNDARNYVVLGDPAVRLSVRTDAGSPP